MALLLKEKKEGTNSIRHMLSRHMNKMLFFLMLIALFGVGFYLETNYQFIQSNNRLLRNNEFFIRLSGTKNYLYERLFHIREENTELLPELSGYIDEFGQEEISVVYQRDIEDIRILFEKYAAAVRELEESIGRGETYEHSLVFYEEASDLLEMMDGYHEPIGYEIINYEERIAEIQQKSVLLYTLVFLITLVLICSTIVTETHRVKQSIIVPLQALANSIEGADFLSPAGNAAMELNSLYNDEVNETIEKYNAMLDKLRQQSVEHSELMNTKLLLKEQMYRNLRHQINPHFLFNTLNMISQTAYLEGCEQTVSLIETTAHLLRYSLDYVEREVTLQQELEALEHYVNLQEQRFAGKIQFRFVLDESFHKMKIPSLILQPLVENAISHGGVMYREDGEILIQTRREPEKKRVRISVIDNGIGMDPIKRKQVDSAMREGGLNAENIGLTNVFFRLAIFYHQQSDIEITSVPGVRTEIALLLPQEQGCEKCIQ